MKSKSSSVLELGEIIETITPPKKIQTSEFLETGNYPIVDQSPPQVAGWTNDITALVHPPKEGLIVFGDHTCVLKFETKPFAQGADGIKILKVKKEINSHFVYAHLKAFPLLNDGYKRHFSELKRLKILIPDLKIQNYISAIHQIIDSKIAANNALSKILEEIAQIIFKSWFIDFDPVKANMVGEKPAGMDAATAALFPDAMEESEIGLIPKGWSWISVGEIASVIDCLHSKKPELLEEGFPYLQLDTISDTGVLRFENAGLISKEDYDKWTSRIEVQGGDCLITNVGRVGAVSQVPDHFKAAIGRNITALRPKDLRLHRSFLIVALLSDFMKKEIKRNTDSGTILEALNVKNIPKLIIPGPSNFVLQEFAKLCDPIQLQLHELHKMNVNLKRIRDSLLPRLISGELKIPEDMLAS
jgi:type I restriction enzyme S subunit